MLNSEFRRKSWIIKGIIRNNLFSTMQTLKWYYRRLKAMSPSEVAWRIQSFLRDNSDKLFISRRQQPRKLETLLNKNANDAGSGFHVVDLNINGKPLLKDDNNVETMRNKSLLERAGKVMDNRLCFFDLKDKHLGDPVIWNRDHKLGKDTPMVFSSSLDYRDVGEAGDCKYVWEPNRHHQLVILTRAYRLSGDMRFAEAAAEQIDSWLRQNPYGLGMNWRSGLELGVRLINWVWTIDIIREAKVISGELYIRLIDSISRHIWEIDRKYSRGSSTNNHLIGEAAGVFVATSYFNNLKYAYEWQKKSREILNREILNQTYSDGGTKEQAIGYHIFVLQFFVVAGVTALATGQDFPESYWSRLEKMFEFIVQLSQGGDNLPMFGDCDDGYVLDIGDDPHNLKEWLEIGAALCGREDFKTAANTISTHADLRPISSGYDKNNITGESVDKKCSSMAFNQSGYYLLQYGDINSRNRISVVFDCGRLGMGALAGHGHADALSFTLRASGKDVLVDPGTYDYFSYPQWRQYFRSTRAHNTIVIDGLNQSEMLGPFLWGKKANTVCIDWQPSETGGKVIGEHDGYLSLKDPVIHRRTLELDGKKKVLIISDDIICRGKHDAAIYFHLAENCMIESVGKNSYLIDTGSAKVEIKLDDCLRTELFCGSVEPIYGWISRGYHRKQPVTTIVGHCICEGNTSLVGTIHINNH